MKRFVYFSQCGFVLCKACMVTNPKIYCSIRGNMDNRWIISDVVKKTGVEAHVLRYWEKELELDIPRNELGHRYYTDIHIEEFKRIHELKDSGYQLKAIKRVLNENKSINEEIACSAKQFYREDIVHQDDAKIIMMPNSVSSQPEVTVNKQDKLEAFKEILSEVMLETIDKHNEDIGNRISDRVIKQMDYLMRMQDELEDEKFKRLDETIRSYQKDRKGKVNRDKKKSKQRHIWKRKKLEV